MPRTSARIPADPSLATRTRPANWVGTGVNGTIRVPCTVATVPSACGPSDLRAGERVRGDLHPQGPAPAQPRRGGSLPVPARGVLGPQLERVPGERRPPLP